MASILSAAGPDRPTAGGGAGAAAAAVDDGLPGGGAPVEHLAAAAPARHEACVEEHPEVVAHGAEGQAGRWRRAPWCSSAEPSRIEDLGAAAAEEPG